MKMFKVDFAEIDTLEKDLKAFANRAYPFATKSAINSTAFFGMRVAKRLVKKKFQLRNKFTQSTIQVHQSRILKVSRQSAELGSTAAYMEDQEFGGTKTAKGKTGVTIPTNISSGESGKGIRKRLTTDEFKLSAIRLSRKRKRGSKAQTALIKIREAQKAGQRFIYLKTARTEGIFKVSTVGSKAKIEMLYDLSRQSVSIPRRPWLKPSSDIAAGKMPEFYLKALRIQVERQGLFR